MELVELFEKQQEEQRHFFDRWDIALELARNTYSRHHDELRALAERFLAELLEYPEYEPPVSMQLIRQRSIPVECLFLWKLGDDD